MKTINEYLLSKTHKKQTTAYFDELIEVLNKYADNKNKKDQLENFEKYSKSYNKEYIEATCEKILGLIEKDTNVMLGIDVSGWKNIKNDYMVDILANKEAAQNEIIIGLYSFIENKALTIVFENEPAVIIYYHENNNKEDFRKWFMTDDWSDSEATEIFTDDAVEGSKIKEFKQKINLI